MFKFPVPTNMVEVCDFQEEHNLKYATARYHLEKMVKAGVLTKSIEGYYEERVVNGIRIYNPMATHVYVNRAVYRPVVIKD